MRDMSQEVVGWEEETVRQIAGVDGNDETDRQVGGHTLTHR